VHPVAGLLVGPDAAVAELIELIEVRQLYFELQRCPVAVASGQRYEHAGAEPAFAGSFDLAVNKFDCTLAVDRQHIIRKTSQIHRDAPMRASSA